jgi:hypothetical protein
MNDGSRPPTAPQYDFELASLALAKQALFTAKEPTPEALRDLKEEASLMVDWIETKLGQRQALDQAPPALVMVVSNAVEVEEMGIRYLRPNAGGGA